MLENPYLFGKKKDEIKEDREGIILYMIQSEDRFLAECLILSKFQQLSNEDSVEDNIVMENKMEHV
jgi:hypothetical protein